MDVDSLRVAELRKELRSRGLAVRGDKAELAARLKAALAVDETALESPEEEAPPSAVAAVEPATESPAIPPVADVSTVAKKIVLNRASVATNAEDDDDDKSTTESRDRRPTGLVMDSKTRLEMRAKRFGLPLSGDALKEARKARFGASAAPRNGSAPNVASLDALKKRAERFGISVSKTMVDAERQERLERRKAKFGSV